MKSVIVKAHPLRCEVLEVPVPQPGPDEILVKVVCCGSNPRDWKAPDHLIPGVEINQGNEMSGIVEEVGENVYEFRKGDRIASPARLSYRSQQMPYLKTDSQVIIAHSQSSRQMNRLRYEVNGEPLRF
jgi:NADPH:quinone reductase-like Zn-dependent oxidoreductase